MRYRAISPSPYLAKYIECFWTLESREKSSTASPERILPDGCVELIFNLADPFKRYHSNRVVEIQPQTLVAGRMRRYAMIEPTGRVKLFGVRFQPGGAYPLFQLPLREFSGQNPTAYFSQDYEISEYFTRKNRLSDFYNIIE